MRHPRTAWAALVLAVWVASAACSGESSAAGSTAAAPRDKSAGGPPSKGGPGRGPGAFPVEVAEVATRPLRYALSAVGSVDAFERVQVSARVAGAVDRLRFREGDLVQKDQVLVEIEPDRYRLAVDVARAGVERAQANHGEAQAALERREAASRANPGLIRGEEVETFRARAMTSQAELLAARTALAQAELNLRDALVRAPIAGVVQTRTVQTGQYVPVGALLATMLRRDPLLLRFKVPEREAQALRTGMEVGFSTRAGDGQRARVILVAAQADDARMVQVVAEVQGGGAELRPGAFAEVQVEQGGADDALVIPETAIRPSERGFLAFVVEGTAAKQRILELGMRTPDGGMEVRSGLSAGEKIVVRGAEALRDGAPVRVVRGGDAAEKPPRAEGQP